MLDQDTSALDEAAKLITTIQGRFDTKINADFLNESVRTMLTSRELKEKLGEFDYIYSMGLFDYLLPPVASKVLDRLFGLLKADGEMAIGNFHVSNPSKYYMEYWLDWVLYYRTEEEFIGLLGDTASKEVDITFDDSGVQMFMHVKKKSS
jgi:extracellular factor (EF) 3-hydroxypalmitic acid methyl ester biosynthesis protein